MARVGGTTLRDMIREDLVAERVAINSYREIIDWLNDKDSATRKVLKGILAVEEKHGGRGIAARGPQGQCPDSRL